MRQTGGHKIADFVFLPHISFILAFRALESIKRYWETSQDRRSDLPPPPPPPPPLMGQTGVIK